MTHYRTARLNEQLKREIALTLRQKVRDPRVGEISVMEVRVTSDLSLARVYVRTLGAEGSEEESLEGLKAAAPFIRTELGKVLHIRRVPELRFLYDTTLDSALRIEKVLKEVLPDEEESGKDPADPEGEGVEAEGVAGEASAPTDVRGRDGSEGGKNEG